MLNSQTWENILNHILPVAREELHTAFYGNILKENRRFNIKNKQFSTFAIFDLEHLFTKCFW